MKTRGCRIFAVVLMLAVSMNLTGCFIENNELIQTKMTEQKLEGIIKSLAKSTSSQNGRLEFTYNGARLILLTSPPHNRMRIVAPITEYTKLTDSQLEKIMLANFHTALDARYAVNGGILYSAYIHPISSLSEDQIKLAVQQVSTLALTFGTTYTSGSLSFSPNQKKNRPNRDRKPI